MANNAFLVVEVPINIDNMRIGFDFMMDKKEWERLDKDEQQSVIEERIQGFDFEWTEREWA